MASFFQKNFFWILGGVLLLALCYYFSNIVAYMLVAWVLSMLGRPVMVFYRKRIRLGRWRMGPTVAAVLTILTFYTVLLGVLLLFVPTVARQAKNISNVDYEAIGDKLEEPMTRIDAEMHRYGLLSQGESLADRVQETLLAWFGSGMVGDILGTFINTAGDLVIAFAAITFILFFFLQDNTLFGDILDAFVPNAYEEKVDHALKDSSEVLTNYFGGLVIQLITFILVVSTLLWLLGVNNSLLIGSFGGIFNIIPYVGPILGSAFGCFIALTSNLELPLDQLGIMLLKVIAAFSVTQFLDNNFLGPLIFSRSVKAHPLEIFLVILAAAQVGGIFGMIIAIPVYTVIRVLARVFLGEFKLVQRWTDHLEENEAEGN